MIVTESVKNAGTKQETFYIISKAARGEIINKTKINKDGYFLIKVVKSILEPYRLGMGEVVEMGISTLEEAKRKVYWNRGKLN